MGFIKLVLITVGIPILGYLVSLGISNDLNNELKKELPITYEEACSLSIAQENAELKSACDEYSNIVFLGTSSKWAGALGLSIIFIFWICIVD